MMPPKWFRYLHCTTLECLYDFLASHNFLLSLWTVCYCCLMLQLFLKWALFHRHDCGQFFPSPKCLQASKPSILLIAPSVTKQILNFCRSTISLILICYFQSFAYLVCTVEILLVILVLSTLVGMVGPQDQNCETFYSILNFNNSSLVQYR